MGYIDTVFSLEGYHDLLNYGQLELRLNNASSLIGKRRNQGELNDANRIYEFVFIPNSGFLNSNLPLMRNCELKLSFDRLNADYSMIQLPDKVATEISGSPITIKNCVAVAEYVRSDALDNYFRKIDTTPITYLYEDSDLTLRNLPMDVTNIRVDNIKGGNTPSCIFAAIIPSGNLTGNMKLPTTSFRQYNVSEFNITLNGNSVNGYPLSTGCGSGVFPLHKFIDSTNRYMNPNCGDGFRLFNYSYNWIYAHKFEAEVSEEGWLGIDIKLTTPYTHPHTLVIWCISDAGITIDKFHQLEKVHF